MHLVSDPAKFELATKRGVPFFHTACDSVEPVFKLTTEPGLVSCPSCRMLIDKLMGAQASAPRPSPEPAPLADFEDDDSIQHLDDIDDTFGGAESAPPAPSPSSVPSPLADGPFAAIQPLLDDLFKNFPVDPLWVRWTMTIEADPQGSEGMLVGDYDPRMILEDHQAEFLMSLARLSTMIGLEGLSSRILTLLHQVVMSGVSEEEVDADQDDAAEDDSVSGEE